MGFQADVSRGALLITGIAGTAFMVVGQAYSMRKRSGFFRSLRMKRLLEQHITLGLIGPLLIMAHTRGEFDGLAGLSALLMVVVVISGFVGRYIYRRIPTRDKEKELQRLRAELEGRADAADRARVQRVERELANYRRMKRLMLNWRTLHIPMTVLFFCTVVLHIITVYYY